MTFSQAIPNPDALFGAIIERSTNAASVLHGPAHWWHVGKVGLYLCEREMADPVVVFLFAIFHDCKRENDGTDPDHGHRGTRLAEDLADDNLFDMTLKQWASFVYACDQHTEPYTTSDPTIGVCWDADRLNMMRVGDYPDPQFLSTEAAKNPWLIERCSNEVWNEPKSWKHLAEIYKLLPQAV